MTRVSCASCIHFGECGWYCGGGFYRSADSEAGEDDLDKEDDPWQEEE